jgi:hypothetical protein
MITSDDLATLFPGRVIVTPLDAVTDPVAALVYTNGDGVVLMIQTLYDPERRPLMCDKCKRLTVHELVERKYLCRERGKHLP